MQEYAALKQDRRYAEAKQELGYLHEKLAHIKRLVNEYDARVQQQHMMAN